MRVRDKLSSLTMKRFVLNALRIVAVIAGIAFWFTPLRTSAQLLICVGSLLVLIICSIISNSMDDEKTGYWPK
jgi:uncharacterized membrane protein HdeD (DUF308 family)